MAERLTISLDGMGGDNAPDSVVEGAAIARERNPALRFLLYGDEARLKPLVAAQSHLADCVEIRHTDKVVANTDKPSVALRSGKQSSMRLAIDAVQSGEADSAVSAGNTGALMAMAMFGLRTIAGVERPAICSFFPTERGETCMLDLGANVACDAENLVQFAVMGEAFARTAMGIEKPTVGLLNVGVEDLKGKDEVKLAAAALRESTLPIEFKGFVEGDDIACGTVDVVVTDGFTGNIALKTAEGTSRLVSAFLREAFQSSLMAKVGYLFARRAMHKLRLRVDPRRYNGAVLLGLNGIVVKSHGGTDSLGFANAIGVAADMATHGFLAKMRHDFEQLRPAETGR
ncbi:phosphate acyltransferase PlsX [Marivibrio halodurans]|uniref:Phosphate acyltransferase n=1 Tax=Marivibrio halodurans TaxID=2039722 RepID=A0A8J7V2H9_9PROT|nr:phosphate acyltransferase PlsX [Marivibrio halodurans]MBP5855784.1 phosphate acyltransferase PlsX [Marivibrio halodurans]